jgi:histone acetyltransferase (RNA polymerase elongator complex component)
MTFIEKLDEWYGEGKYKHYQVAEADDAVSVHIVEAQHEYQLVRLFRIGDRMEISIELTLSKDLSLTSLGLLANQMYEHDYRKLING